MIRKFEGIRLYSVNIGAFRHGAALALPGIGIFVGKSNLNNRALLQHEYGHFLQYKKWGFRRFWRYVAFSSLRSARAANRRKVVHQHHWTEWSANRLAYHHFNRPADWDFNRYPVQPPAGFAKQTYPPFATGLKEFDENWLKA